MKFVSLLLVLAALVAAVTLLVAGPGARLDFWDFRFGFTLMRWALYIGAGTAAVALLLVLIPPTRRGQALKLASALVIGLSVAAVPYLQVRQARSVPPIHDISTDTLNPPAFVAIAPLRADAPNPIEYPGEDVARQQREAYPGISSFTTDVYPAILFEHAVAVARNLGWEVVATDQDEGRIEATDTTFWFGFKDDVVIRIRANNDGSIVDLRSKSRVGMSDVGANAARIRGFLEALEDRMN